MRELIDCHIHTERCGHATGTVSQMVSAALFRGAYGVILTEHLPLPEDLDAERHLSMQPDVVGDYVIEVLDMDRRAKNMRVVLGAEADWLPGREAHTTAGLARARELGVAVVLGSVHFIGDWAFDDPHNIEEWESRSIDEAWTAYFELWCAAARSQLFDVMAHPDLVKKFGHRCSFDAAELYRNAAMAAADGGVCIEVSTAGLRKPVGELYPGHDLLAAFRAADVPATVGSDAHSPDEVCFGIPEAYDALANAGYNRAAFPTGRGELEWISLE